MPTDTLACWNCGFENAAGARFCSNCGRPQRAACPECGAQVADGAKFCSNCGIPLGSPTRQGEDPSPALAAEARKIITVVFADLVGSTSLTERLDPEEARDVVGKFYRVVQTAVERFEGAVANLLGDAVLAVFGLPLTHEDDPERAVRAGLALRDALPALNEHFGAAHGVALDLRVGINTGEVVAASGSTFDRDFLVSDAVTTAARLQQSVAPGLVVVGERTYRLTRDAIDYRPLPPLEVKGKTAALAVWEAVAPLPERSEIRRIAAPLVGRHGELGILRYLYHRSRDESLIHLATVLGQAGVGKSRLVREFLAEVRESEPRPLILRGRSVAFGQHIGYHALLDVLRAQAGLLDTDPADVMRAKLDAWLRDVLPGQVGLLEGLLLTFGGEDGTHSDPGQMRHLLFEVWQALLGGLAAQQPVILVLEDVHWADDGLLDLVAWLTEHIDAAPVLLLCAGRPELLERRPTWGAGRRNATSIDLAPLRSGEAEQLVAALSSEGMSSEMRQTIAQRAEGNPFFVEELVRMLLEGSGPGAAIPDTVQAVLTARLDRLPPHEHRVVQAAAVFGRTFWTSAVSPLAGLSEDDTLKATDALIAKELIVRRPHSSLAGQREFAFRHILTRDVAYGMLPKSQRQRAHLQAARWLESQLEERVEEAVEILAEHLRLGGDDAQAARYLQRAASKARRLYANADAIRLYSQAEESARRVGLRPRELAALYLGRGEVYQLTGDYAMALTDFGQGLDAAREAQDPALEATLENRVGLVHHRQMRLAEAQEHFARTASLARQIGDKLTLGLSLIDQANVAWDRGQMDANHPALNEGISLLREAGDPSSVARAFNLLCMARFGAGEYSAAIEAAQQGLAAAREAGDKSREATSLSYLSTINGFWGKYRDSIQDGSAAIELAQEIGDRRRYAFTISMVGHSRAALGEWGDGVRLLEESVPLTREFFRVHLPFPLMYLGILYHEIGSRERAQVVLEEASQIETHNPSWLIIALTAGIYLARLKGEAEALLQDLSESQGLPWGIFLPSDCTVILPLGEALLEVGRVDEARQFLAARRPSAETFGALPHLAAIEIVAAQLALHDGK